MRQWLAALVDAIAQDPVSATDLGYIQAMQSHCERLQDCDTMRRVRAHTLGDNNPHQDGLHGLAENSRQLCEQLFEPMQ
mgnify:CR=1 FL=1